MPDRDVIGLFNIMFPLCSAASGLVLIDKLPDLRRDWTNAALRALCAAQAITMAAYLLATPAVFVRLDRQLGIASGSALARDVCVTASVGCTHLMVAAWFRPDALARRTRLGLAAFVGAVLVTMVVLFAAAHVTGEHPIDFQVQFARRCDIAAYLMVYLVACTTCVAGILYQTWRHAPMIGSWWLHKGLRVTIVGCALVLGSFVGKMTGIIGRWSGTTRLDLANVLAAPLMACAGTLIFAASLIIPEQGRRAAAAAAVYHQYRRIYPLWSQLVRAVEGLALDPPARRRLLPPLPFPALTFRLTRAVVEIYQAELRLRPYQDPVIEPQLRAAGTRYGLYDVDLDAYVQAGLLHCALQARARGDAPQQTPVPESGDEVYDAELTIDNPAAYLAHVVRVALHFTDSGCLTREFLAS